MTAAPTLKAKPTLTGVYRPGQQLGQAFGLCIYGRGGVGKTSLLGTMPGRGLIIDVPQIEGGTFVLEAHAERIDVVPVESWDAINAIYWFLAKGEHDYQWVAIDSITAFQELAKRKTISDRALDIMDPHTMTLQEYGKVGRLLGEMVYKFRTLKQHTIWIAQERKFGGDNEGERGIIGPDVLPSALSMLMPSMLMMARLSVEFTMMGTAERHLRLGASESYYTKCRSKSGIEVPHVIRNPHLGKLLKFILGSGEKPDEVQETGLILG